MHNRFEWLPQRDGSVDYKSAQGKRGPVLPANAERYLLATELPSELWTHITTFLHDDDRFDMRVLNRAFYFGFYQTRTSHDSRNQVNAERALALASKGRKFRNVTHLTLEDGDFPTHFNPDPRCPCCSDPQCYCRLSDTPKSVKCCMEAGYHVGLNTGFPRLSSIRAEAPRLLPAFGRSPGITRITVLYKSSMAECTVERFPNLTFLSGPYLSIVQPHPKLEVLRAEGMDEGEAMSVADLWKVGKTHFPNLRRIEAAYDGRSSALMAGPSLAVQCLHVMKLRSEGIKIVHEDIHRPPPEHAGLKDWWSQSWIVRFFQDEVKEDDRPKEPEQPGILPARFFC